MVPARALCHGPEVETGFSLEKGFAHIAGGGAGVQTGALTSRPVLSAQGDRSRAPGWVADGLASALSDSEQQVIHPTHPGSQLASGWEGGSQ